MVKMLKMRTILTTRFRFTNNVEDRWKMKYCGKCGSELDSNAGFCPKCGKKQMNGNVKPLKKKIIIN